MAPSDYVVEQLKSGDLKFAVEDPDAPENWPRVLTVWRANLLGSSSKGNEYFLKHLLGTSNAVRAEETPPRSRPQDVTWREETPEGKLDLLVSIDFRMTSTGAVRRRRAARGHLVREARPVRAPTCTRSCTRSPRRSTRRGRPRATSRSSRPSAAGCPRWPRTHLGTRTDVVMVPLQHDTPDETGRSPAASCATGSTARCEPIPGQTMPRSSSPSSATTPPSGTRWSALGPLVDKLGTTDQGRDHGPDPGGRGPGAGSTG